MAKGTLPPWLQKPKSGTNNSVAPTPPANGPSPTTAVGGGMFKSKGRRRKAANHASNLTMKGQAGNTTQKAHGTGTGMAPGSKPGAKPW